MVCPLDFKLQIDDFFFTFAEMRLDSGHERHFGSWHDEVDFILLCEVDKFVKLCDANVDICHLFLSVGAAISCLNVSKRI